MYMYMCMYTYTYTTVTKVFCFCVWCPRQIQNNIPGVLFASLRLIAQLWSSVPLLPLRILAHQCYGIPAEWRSSCYPLIAFNFIDLIAGGATPPLCVKNSYPWSSCGVGGVGATPRERDLLRVSVWRHSAPSAGNETRKQKNFRSRVGQILSFCYECQHDPQRVELKIVATCVILGLVG